MSTELELLIGGLLDTAAESSSTLALAGALSAFPFLAKYILEWVKTRRARQDVHEQRRHEDAWKLLEEKKAENRRLRHENRALSRLYRESLNYHIDAQNAYMRSMAKVKDWIHLHAGEGLGKFRCTQPSCPVRAAISSAIDKIVTETAEEANTAFRKWMESSTDKDTPPEV